MKNKQLFAIILSIIIFSAPVGFAEAQVPNVPAPVPSDNICFDAQFRQMPCGSAPSKLKPSSDLEQKIQKNASELYTYLVTNINKIIKDLEEGYQNIYDGLRDFFGKRF